MGRRSRRRSTGDESFSAGSAEYTDPEHGVLVLRAAMSPRSRRAYKKIATGEAVRASATREDLHHREVEFLFERLAESWTIAGLEPLTSKELLPRFRMASSEERGFIVRALREHCAEHFPELDAP